MCIRDSYKVIMGHMEGSTEILAARALAGNIEDLCTVAIFAIGNTTAIIVGREIGAGRREHVYEVGATLDTLAFLCGLIIGIPLILGCLLYTSHQDRRTGRRGRRSAQGAGRKRP